MNEEEVCCICNEHKKFLGRMNVGQKLYCMQCQAKITEEYGMDYWKPCSFQEFMEAFSSSINKGKRKPVNMFDSLRETLRKFDDEAKNREKKNE